MQYIDMTIEFLWIHILCMHNRWEVFAEVLAEYINSAGPQSEKSNCIFRASSAQAKRIKKMHPGGSQERDPMFHRVIIPTKILDKARKILPERFVYTTEEKRPTAHCSEGKAKESKERYYVL